MIFQVVSGVKVQKMTQNNKKICLSHSVSQEPLHHMIVVLVTH